MVCINPVFNEFITFLNNQESLRGAMKEENIELKEGYYWLDRMIIKAFDSNGDIHKIARITFDKTERVVKLVKKYQLPKEVVLISWKELALLKKERLKDLEKKSVEKAKELLSSNPEKKPLLCHSGGKDSTVNSHILKLIDSDMETIFNNTSNESAETYKFIKNIDNLRILNPEQGFFQYMKEEKFIPSRLARSCCKIYKHELTLKNLDKNEKYLLFMGIRNAESNRRKNYDYLYQFSYYPDNWSCGLVIKDWLDLDIWLYIFLEDIEFNKFYKNGYSRCGCIICPFRSDFEELMTSYYYPKQVERFKDILEDVFINNQTWIGVNCTIDEFKNKSAWKVGLYRESPNEEVLREFSNYKGIDTETAKKFFNRKCTICDKNVRRKDLLALNMKLLGRNSNVLCSKHLKEELSRIYGRAIKEKDIKEMIKELKGTGCELF